MSVHEKVVWKKSLITPDEVFDVEVIRWGGTGWGIQISSEDYSLNFHPDDWQKLGNIIAEAAAQCPYPARPEN